MARAVNAQFCHFWKKCALSPAIVTEKHINRGSYGSVEKYVCSSRLTYDIMFFDYF